ncbi:MAG: MFS transporter [Verrucomicrobiota bacterium]
MPPSAVARDHGPAKPAGSPWAWIPTLYFFQGLPNVLVASVSLVVYKNLGLSNAAAAFYTSWLYLPWVLKPLWSPLVDVIGKRRDWIWIAEFLVSAGFAAVALTIPTPWFVQLTLALFWLTAAASATHDIAADGFYILALDERRQSFFSGVRNTGFNLAKIAAQGGLVALAGRLKSWTGSFAAAWSVTFLIAAAVAFGLGLYHSRRLPRPESDQPGRGGPNAKEFLEALTHLFHKPGLPAILSFLLLYRFAEAQLLKMVQPFLIDTRAAGGLGLSNESFGLVYGTAGVAALVCGGLLGGYVVSRSGLKSWLWPMALAMHVPDAVFLYLSWAQPESLQTIGCCVALEQFGYGFGFTAYMLYMIHIARGRHSTATYALCTGVMALGLMLPGMWSGWLQEQLGYRWFFLWVLLATIPGFVVITRIPLEREFGKRAS